jgi:hypothetical protein
MSLYAKLAAVCILIVGLWALHHKVYTDGVRDTEAKYEAKAEADRVFKQEGIDNVSSTFVAKTAKSRTIVQSNQDKVTQYVPPTDCPLSAGFRLLYDANATGQAVDDSRRATATAVTAQDVARTTGENFAICRYDQDRLEALQAIVKTMNGD